MKKISRKSFLKLAAATTAGAAMTPALMGCGWPSAQDLAPTRATSCFCSATISTPIWVLLRS